MMGAVWSGVWMRVEAMATRYPTRRWEAMARGAALEAEGGRLRFLPPTARPGTGWDLAIGTGPGEVAELVRVFGSVETGPRASGVWVDHYVPLSAEGRQLAAGVASGLNDYLNGWFPVAAVRQMAEEAGLGYRGLRLRGVRPRRAGRELGWLPGRQRSLPLALLDQESSDRGTVRADTSGFSPDPFLIMGQVASGSRAERRARSPVHPGLGGG